MIVVDAEIKEFVRRINLAIAIARRLNASGTESATKTVENLEAFRELALNGKLPRPSRGEVPPGTGLGLTRGIGEWTEDDDLLDAAYSIEDFYKNSV